MLNTTHKIQRTTSKKNSTASCNSSAVDKPQLQDGSSRGSKNSNVSAPRTTGRHSAKSRTKVLAKAIILELLSLEHQVILLSADSKKTSEEQIDSKISQNLENLNKIFKNLLLQKFSKNYYVYAYCLLKRALALNEECDSKTRLSFRSGDVTKIFCICFFMAFKMLEDNQIMFIEDLGMLTGYSQEMIQALETALIDDILEWRVRVTKKELDQCKVELIASYKESQDE